jgi:hypothetical protein
MFPNDPTLVIPNEAEPNDDILESSVLEAQLRNRFEKAWLKECRFLDFARNDTATKLEASCKIP